MLPKEKLERLVIDQLKQKILTDENLEQLVLMVNEDLRTGATEIKERMGIIDAEQKDAHARLAKLYDALETAKLSLDDLAPRIKEMKARQDDLNKSRIQLEAELIAQGVEQVDLDTVKCYAQDLRNLIEEAELVERKTFLRSFIKRIVIDKDKVTLLYKLPMPKKETLKEETAVLSIVTPGGAEGIRTPYLLNAIEALSQLSYSPSSIYQSISINL